MLGEVLRVDIVVNLAKLALVSRLILDDLVELLFIASLEGALSARWVLEADKAIHFIGKV